MELSPEARAARREYAREYYARNAERIKLQRARYWERKAQAATAAEPGQGNINSTNLTDSTNST